MTPLRLGLLAWGVEHPPDIATFAARLDRLAAEGAAHADLLLLPEYACMEVAGALATRPGAAAELDAACAHQAEILDAMRAAAVRHRVWLAPGSLPWREGGRVRNRAPLIAPDGRMAFQEKRVMTRFETEEWGVQGGADPAVFATPWGRIGLAVCYDAEFPPLVRAQALAGAWLVLVPACTDTRHGSHRVRLAARARAMENQCFVAVAPTVGDAPWSATLDTNRGVAGAYGPVDRGFPEDGILAEGTPDRPGWLFVTLDPARLDTARRDGAVRHHRDWPDAPPPCPVVAPA